MTKTTRSRRSWQAFAVALALFSVAGTAQASAASAVDINRFAFHPPALTISAGSRVVFSNSSKVTHTATAKGAFNTGRIAPGASVGIRFKRRGSFAYHCSIHPFMRGKVVVR